MRPGHLLKAEIKQNFITQDGFHTSLLLTCNPVHTANAVVNGKIKL